MLKNDASGKSDKDSKCKDILVSGLSPDTTEEEIIMYFQSKRSGGGDVENIQFDKDQHHAIVTFDESEGKKKSRFLSTCIITNYKR